jgi:hypothetical protein
MRSAYAWRSARGGGNIAWMILRETLYLVLAGLILGVPAALMEGG